jgi:hypothetical protein
MATAMIAMKGKKISPRFVPFFKPGRIERTKKGAPAPITLRAKSSFITNTFEMSHRVEVAPWTNRYKHENQRSGSARNHRQS